MTIHISVTIPDEYYTSEVEKLINECQSAVGLLCNEKDSWAESTWRDR
tara:strand:+ start:823 stop:966 length:144 start_codon:yes stop_codon:yes gene_type:complete